MTEKFNFHGKDWEPVGRFDIKDDKLKLNEKEGKVSREVESKKKLGLYREDLAEIYALPEGLSLILLEKVSLDEKKQSIQQEITDEQKSDNNKEYLEQLSKELEDINMYIEYQDRKLERLVNGNKDLKEKYEYYLTNRDRRNDIYTADPKSN